MEYKKQEFANLKVGDRYKHAIVYLPIYNPMDQVALHDVIEFIKKEGLSKTLEVIQKHEKAIL